MEGDTNNNVDNDGDAYDADDEVNYTNDDHFCANYDDNVVRGGGGDL